MGKYENIIEHIFMKKYISGSTSISFSRDELVEATDELGYDRIKNLGDIPYSFRFRRAMPTAIQKTASGDAEWIIVLAGVGEYQFRLASPGKITSNKQLLQIKIPESTPDIIRQYSKGTDEQALLTRARYNRLVDIFTGLTCYSVQNHLRTTVAGIGQVEVDEIYVGLNKHGTHFVLPCQAKSPGEKFGIVQAMQDIALCRERFPDAICRPIAMQFMSDNRVAILELAVVEEEGPIKLNIVDEKHYELIPRTET